MDKDFQIVIDQLVNNEADSDESLARFLSRNTPWEYKTLLHLITNIRPEMLRAPVSSSPEYLLEKILPYLD